jgi:hypothetical protein
MIPKVKFTSLETIDGKTPTEEQLVVDFRAVD